ncbi:STAS domain-containing protein [Actinomadura sp. WMMA1423]|uniref:STAS domain-containing protein n=1 Tax=Actinomadura sp. WMMA1423 TaxID=2591108 RepID=UPI001146C731|nr:STAS domain-containing protein [Actinomadura sp. WMMA1423]
MQTAGTAPSEDGLRRERFAEHTVITITGDLDISSAPSLRERLDVALRDAGPHVVIDLSGVTFCDASGLALLTGARRRAEREGASIVLAAPRPHMIRLLRVSGLSRMFAVRPSVDAARASGAGVRPAAA